MHIMELRKFPVYHLLWVLIPVVFTGCQSTATLQFETLEPAPVELAGGTKRIGIINESRPFKSPAESEGLNQLVALRDEKIVQHGSIAAMQAVQAALQKDPMVDTVLLLDKVHDFTRNNETATPEIPWDSIERVCDTYQLDAIFSLESYGTDTRISFEKSTMEDTDMLRMKISIPAREITLETLLENGWRIYDPARRLVLDEITFTDQFSITAKGKNPLQALEAVTGRMDSLMHTSIRNGREYGMRLQPYNRGVYRQYYSTGTAGFKTAHQLVLEGDLAGASRIWEQSRSDQNARVSCRAHHNMAVYQEYLENLQAAFELASRAEEIHPCKTADRYLEILGERISSDTLLQKQLAARALPVASSK